MGEPDLPADLREEYVTVARIRRPQGRRGEVSAELLTDFPDRFHPGKKLWLWKGGEERRSRLLEESWFHKGGIILKFAVVEDIGSAEMLAGWEVQIPRNRRAPLEGPAVYLSDLVGCRVVEHGVELGHIQGVDDRVGTPVLVVDTPRGELLVPFAAEICRHVDTEAGLVEVELPEGLAALNKE